MPILKVAIVLNYGIWSLTDIPPQWVLELYTYWNKVGFELPKRGIGRVISAGGRRYGRPSEASTTAELLGERFDFYAQMFRARGVEVPDLNLVLQETGRNTWQNLVHSCYRYEHETREARAQGTNLQLFIFGDAAKKRQIELWMPIILGQTFGAHANRVKPVVVPIQFYDSLRFARRLSTAEGLVGYLSPGYRRRMEEAGPGYNSPFHSAVAPWVKRFTGKDM